MLVKLAAEKKPAAAEPKKEATRANARMSKSEEPKRASPPKEKTVSAKPAAAAATAPKSKPQ